MSILVTANPTLSRPETAARLAVLAPNHSPALVDHLSTYNGIDASHWRVSFGDEQTGDLRFLGFDWPTGDLEYWSTQLREELPSGALPLALDAGGNVFVVTAAGTVRFWDHDVRRLKPAFASIAALLSALEHAPPTSATSTGPDYRTLPIDELVTLIDLDVETHGHAAAKAGRIDAMDYLIATYPEHQVRFLMGAVRGNAVATVEHLVALGVPIDGTPGESTPLAVALAGSRFKIAKLLIAQGADPTLDPHGRRLEFLCSTDALYDLVTAAVEAWNRD